MRKSIKMIAVSAAAVLGVATVGVGWAWFTESATAEATGGAGANMAALEVVGSPTYVYETGQNGLYPNHAANVKITVKNPSSNGIGVTITSVKPAATNPIVVTQLVPAAVNTGTNQNTCKGWLSQPASITPTVPAGEDLVLAPGDQVELTLANGVALSYEATNICQGMTFTTQWDIESQNN